LRSPEYRTGWRTGLGCVASQVSSAAADETLMG
jgi:hypothetical protein